MQILTLNFLVCRPILSLPKWHGARWTAWLRNTAQTCGYALEELLMGLKPLQNGLIPLQQGEEISLLLILKDGWESILPEFLKNLDSRPVEGEFCPQKLALKSVTSFLSGRPLWFAGQPFVFQPGTFSESSIFFKMEKLLQLDKWTIRFDAPLRLSLPSRQNPGQRGVTKFAPPEFMATRQGLLHMLNRIRFMNFVSRDSLPESVQITHAGLAWEDMRYNAARQMALGGITGEIVCSGKPDYDLGRRLLAGEFCGAGKNARFGFGFWHIIELKHAKNNKGHLPDRTSTT